MSILEFIIFLIIGSIVLPNIYNQINDIINYQPQSEFDPGDLTNDICLGGICQNKCDNLNGQEVKRTGNTALLNQNNTFQAVDCGDDKVLRDLRYGGILCGEEGTDECNSGHCCYPKLCENDLDPLDDDDYNRHYPTPEAKIEKKRRDGNCPYQKTVKKDTPCSGGNPGERGGCTDEGDSCCVPKTCANNWVSDQNPEWGSQTTCPHQPDNVEQGSMIKYPDDTPCDSCDISECCYEQRDYCIVEANGVYNHANTNVQNVAFPSGTSLSFPANDNTSVDLTTNYFLRKTDVSQESIQNLLSFGSEDGTDNSSYGIKCEDGFKYGMCSSTDGSIDDDACKTHDNNQRECEAAGCIFTLGDRPRVEYDECGGAADHNIIKVHDCINTCTADYTLSDNGINYFTQTPISEGANMGSYRVNPLYDNTGKNSGQEFESGTNVRKYCNNYFGTGEARTYSYTCGGGGSYFTVDELENCNSTCGELRSQGQNCAENKIYNPETNPDTNSLPSNFADFNENCCIPKTCNNGSSGTEIGCRNYEKIIETESPIDSSGSELPINSNNCCERLTCSDYLNEFNRVSVGGGHEGITSENICNSGTFRPENPVSFAYLNSFTSGGSDTEKYNIFKSYQTGVPIEGDTPVVDIGCCQQLTCQEWANHPGNIPGNIPGESEQASANRYCNNNGDGINVFNMSGTFNGNSLDEAVEPGNNSCCISSENITCSPSDELMNPASLVGYNGSPLPENPGPIEFEYDRDSSTFSTVVGDNPYDGVTCTGEGTPSLQCTRDANGDNHRYTLTGCNVEPNENVCDDGQSLANGSPKFCVLPNLQDDDHHGVVLSNFITGVSGNAIVNVRNFAHQLDNIQCENSTSHPCMSECTNDVLTTSYSGVQTERNQAGEGTYSEADYDSSVHIHIEGCDYKNDFSTTSGGQITNNFFMDQYYNGNNGYTDCFELYEPRRATGSMPDDFDKSKINVKHFKCHCGGTQEDPNLPNYGGQLAESCDPSDRHIRFKYVFDDDVDYLTDDKRHIKNSDALAIDGASYNQGDILNSGDSICEPGYYPYRGDKEDYCKPCTDLYKNNHPVSAIADRFCNSGHLFDSGDNISLLRRPEIRNTEYNSNYESNSGDISVLRPTRVLGDGNTRTNQEYGPYLGNLGEEITDINNDIDFMTADNFTLGTRVCDPEPGSGTACAPKVKIYGDYNLPATEGSQFDKAKKWWRTYFNNIFNNGGDHRDHRDNSDILDISSAPGGASSETKPILTSNLRDSNNKLVPGLGRFGVNDITDLKKEHYLYRYNLRINMPAGVADGWRSIPTVCNNNTSEVDYIPSFDSVDSNEGECKECVNEMPPTNDKLIRDGNAPPNTPGDYIIRNIDNDANAPICSYEANMYDESYNEGNIVGFKNKEGGGWPPGPGPCNAGFVYDSRGTELYTINNQEPTTSTQDQPPSLQNYVKCMPSPKYITQFCENITHETICNKSFSGYLTRDEEGRLSNDLKEKLEENERQMINNLKTHGFCGWVDGKCQNIYKFPDHHLAHKLVSSSDISDEYYSDENYSEHKSLHKLQSAMESLSPHITNYASYDKYDYSNLYNSILSEEASLLPYDGHPTHLVNGGGIKPPSDPVFNISNYGVGKDGGDTTHLGDDLISLSIANALKEGYGLYNPPSDPHYEGALYDLQDYSYRYSPSDFTGFDNPDQGPLVPTRINPPYTILNYDMRNRCHPILWDGPVDFFYENERLDKTTISSSCYLRDGSTLNASGDHIVPNGSGDYSIKSTPLYYDKGRNLLGGSIVGGNYSARDKANNILNPGENRDGIMYAEPQTDSQSIGTNDSGFTDAAIFPLIDRVRGCFNDSLIYDSAVWGDQQHSSLGLGDDNIQNEREQCIRHFNHPDGILRCVRACLNHNECDLVRWKHIADRSFYHGSCELLKWNKLPDTITEKTTRLNPGNNQGTYSDVSGTISNYNLGGHLINANTELYDQSTRQGVVNWLERVRGGSDGTQPGEMNHTVTVGDNRQYRTDFYSPLPGDNWSDLRDWRMNHLVKDGSRPGQEIEIKGRSLWRSTGIYNDEEVWISMNKIRAPTPDGKITDILNNINDHELPDIRHMGECVDDSSWLDSNGYDCEGYGDDISQGQMPCALADALRGTDGRTAVDACCVCQNQEGGHGTRLGEWRKSYPRSHTNEESIYYSNDSSIQNFPDKFNEKTVIDSSGNHKQCPPGTYVQGTDSNYKCSQVINECADCQDIFNYHNKKGDFEGMDTDGEKNEILLSYGCTMGILEFSPNIYIGSDFIHAIPGGPNRANRIEPYNASNNVNFHNTGFNINDSIDPPYETVTKHPAGKFSGQHNLMAKTPDGNIIDAERCMCPEGKTVRTRLTSTTYGNPPHTRPIGHCG